MTLTGPRSMPLPGIVMLATTFLSGCAVLSGAGTETVTARSCPQVGDPVDLGAHALDTRPTVHVALSGGRYQLTATGFPHDLPFDPPTGRTRVVWGGEGAGGAVPSYDPGRATVVGAHGSVVVVERVPTVLDLEAGTWWFLNSNGARLSLQPCEGASVEVIAQR